MKETNNQAFIDGQNLAISTKCAKTPWVIDLKRFRTFLAERFNVSEAYYFIGAFDSSKQNLYSALQRFGYIVIFREHACGVLSHKKGNVDTDIVFLVMKKLVEKEDFDRVVLVSGDGDYWRMVDYLIKSNKFCKLLVPNEYRLSSLYRLRMPDSYRMYLDDSSTKRKIILKKRKKQSKKDNDGDKTK